MTTTEPLLPSTTNTINTSPSDPPEKPTSSLHQKLVFPLLLFLLLASSIYVFLLPSQIAPPLPPLCTSPRLRKDLRDLTPFELNRWRSALYNLTTYRHQPSNLTRWESLQIIHISNLAEGHGGAYFLPWHRLLLLKLEDYLREVHPDISLPYWDWTRNAGDLSRDMIWGTDYVGGAADGVISDGPFKELFARFPHPHYVYRPFTSGKRGSILPVHGARTITRLLAVDEWSKFANAWEVAHNLVHSEIGGDMSSVVTAPNDPVFYLHHAFVDFLWAKRQERRGFEYGGTHTFGDMLKNVTENDILNAYGRPVGESVRLSCVTYEPTEGGLEVDAVAGLPGTPCTHKEVKAGVTLNEARCWHGQAVLDELRRRDGLENMVWEH